MNKISNKKIAIFFVALLIMCGAIISIVYQKVQEKDFKTNLIAAACYSVKQEIENSDTIKFNNSIDSYLVSNEPDGTYTIHGYIDYMNINDTQVRKPFSVRLKYVPSSDKKYQIISAKID